MARWLIVLCGFALAAAAPVHGPLNPDAPQKAADIIDFLTIGPGKGQSYQKLSDFVDAVGSRISGSQGLENAVTYMTDMMRRDGLENVHGELVWVPKWVRGNEYAQLVSPRAKPLAMLGLGNSVGTGRDGIEASVLVVATFEELEERAARNETQGKIIVFNQYCDWEAQPIGCYSITNPYRTRGASEASKAGAVAALVRSLASFSIDSPHTGTQTYTVGVEPIPVACISTEDASLLARMQARGIVPRVHLYMEAQTLPDVQSFNVVAEITGAVHPDQVVIVSGHLDSWDVGQGAMDDGSGAVLGWQILSTVQQLGLRPDRTLRVVMWTCEEFGGIGAQQYFTRHQTETGLMSFVTESDMGDFMPDGLSFSGTEAATNIMKDVMALLEPINATQLYEGGATTDTRYFAEVGVPVGAISTHNDKYFYFHHTHGDTMTVYTSEMLDRTAALYAVIAYTVADMPDMLPR